MTDVDAELQKQREQRSRLLNVYFNRLNQTSDLYQMPNTALAMVQVAWLDSRDEHAIKSISLHDTPGIVSIIPGFLGGGRYAAVIETEGAGRFTGLCNHLSEGHWAFLDALVAYIEDIQRVRKDRST